MSINACRIRAVGLCDNVGVWEPVERDSSLARAIERHSEKLGGKPVFRGTRVPVDALFENLRDGCSVEQFLEWFPGVRREQVDAVLRSIQ